MRSRDQLIHDFAELAGALSDRMEVLVRQRPDSRLLERFDRLATKVVDDLTRLQRSYLYVSDKLDAAIGIPTPPAPRPNNVLSFRPSARRKS